MKTLYENYPRKATQLLIYIKQIEHFKPHGFEDDLARAKLQLERYRFILLIGRERP